MTTTLGHQAMGRHGKVGNALVGCSVAAPRSTTRRTCSRPAAVRTPRMTATATVSVLPRVLFLFNGDPECGQGHRLVHPQPQRPGFARQLPGDRAGRKATVITSQLPIEHWHEWIGDATVADAMIDRIMQNNHRLTLTGESLRKTKTSQQREGNRG